MSDPTSWSGIDPEGMEWKVEVETDMFHVSDPPVVAIWINNTETMVMDSLAPLNATEARQMATALLGCADELDAWKARIAKGTL